MSSHLNNSWDEKLESEFSKDYFEDIRKFLRKEYGEYRVYPPIRRLNTLLTKKCAR